MTQPHRTREGSPAEIPTQRSSSNTNRLGVQTEQGPGPSDQLDRGRGASSNDACTPGELGDSDGVTASVDSKSTPASGDSNDARDAKDPKVSKDSKDGDEKDDGGKDDDGKDGKAGKEREPPSKKPLFVISAVVLVLAIVGLWYWFDHRNEIDTDDAYTDGNAITIAPKISGYVVELLVNDNSYVHRGDLLVRIDPRDTEAARDQAVASLELAQAQLESAQAQLAVAEVQYPAQLVQARAQEKSASAALAQAEASYERQHGVDVRATTLENIDAANSQQSSAQANVQNAQAQVRVADLIPQQLRQVRATVAERRAAVAQAQAELEQAELNLSYAEIRAPADGWVTRRNVQFGSYLQAGSALFMLVTQDIWVTANFKESQLTRMRVGNAVSVRVDAYPKLRLSGHIDSVQLGSGSRFSAFPAENATGNFVKIVQRVPVKIIIDHGLDRHHPLPLGLSVDPVVRLP